ncbi:MAG: double zinc ribbon domain-containing protein [Oscillospiraceae bacterium]|jgi:ComF family protein|nr:double zinc ribbon domain-containing protein [Oscillospiraceae bacterium]
MNREWLLNILFPSRCPFCGTVISSDETTCQDCSSIEIDNLIRPMPLKEQMSVCCYAAYWYQGVVRQAILRMKFKEEPSICTFFGKSVAKIVRERLPDMTFDAVTAVPMTRLHQMRRGYNQSILIAKSAARELHLPYRNCLRKVRHNRIQHRLTAEERRKNVRGAYCALPCAAGLKLLLVDDIVTTGATLSECTQQLLNAGAVQVVCAAAASSVPEKATD